MKISVLAGIPNTRIPVIFLSNTGIPEEKRLDPGIPASRKPPPLVGDEIVRKIHRLGFLSDKNECKKSQKITFHAFFVKGGQSVQLNHALLGIIYKS